MNKEISHIPHTNVLLWQTDGEPENFKKAQKAKEKRDFGIRFFLEDPRARTPYVYLSLEKEIDQSVMIENQSINIWFEKNVDGFLDAFFIGLKARSFNEAFRLAYSQASNIQSNLTFFYTRPVRVRFIEIFDKKFDLKYYNPPTCPKTVDINSFSPIIISKEVPFGSLLALYREGMNSLDLSYRYISFFKIYEAWKKNEFAFRLTNNALGEQKKERKPLKITEALLSGVHIGIYREKFLNKKFKDVFDKLNQFRNFLAHSFLDKTSQPSFINLNDIESIELLEGMSNLVERMATKILKEELFLLSKCGEEFKKFYESYQGIHSIIN